MNNKGQSLFLFVLFLPIIIFALILIFDSAYITINNNRLNNIAYDALKYLVVDKKDKEEVKKIVLLNDENIEIIEITDNSIYLRNNIKPIFGTYMGYKKYELSINLEGYIENEKLITKEKGS